ncbi:MAG: N-acetylmuramoyl-L-alanine amidase [Acidobacteriota bacterium]|nr:N-acetylmuramoyl-L-alanine amidase [Acidobacteriota bacterium]
MMAAQSANPSSHSEKPRVTAVRFWTLVDTTRIAIETTGQFEFRTDRLQNPERLFFDIVGAKRDTGGVQTIPVGDRLIRQIRVAETQLGVTRVVLDLSGNIKFSTSQLSNPDRLIVDVHPIDHVVQFRPPPTAPTYYAEPAVERTPDRQRAAVALLDPPALSVLSRRGKAKPDPLASVTGAGANLAVPPPKPPAHPATASRPSALPAKPDTRVDTRVETVDAGPSVTPLPNASLSASILKNPKSTPEVGLPAKRTPRGDDTMTRVLGLKLRRVVLDAGHGGGDTGTSGPDGLREKDVALDVAKRLGALIQERLGSEVIYTRSDDTFVPLGRRTAIANEANADLFLSIHVNSSPVRAVSGVETYYLSFTTSHSAMETAARENAGAERNMHELPDLLRRIALNDKLDESREFASRIQTSLVLVAARVSRGTKDRGLKKAPFVVLIGASMPAVLVEIGFLTNSQEELMMRRGDHLQRIADALYRGVSSYANGLSHFQVAQQSAKRAGE